MTDEQKTLYRESMQKSKRYLMEVQEEEPLPDNPPPKKGRGRAPKKQVAKQAENSSNILMDLRKAANHPMLFRKLYDDKKIGVMAKDCLKEPEWSEKDPKYIEEDMSVMSKSFQCRLYLRSSMLIHECSRLRAPPICSALQGIFSSL